MKLARMLGVALLALTISACGGSNLEEESTDQPEQTDEVTEVVVDKQTRWDVTGTLFRELPDKTWVMCVYLHQYRAGGIDCDFDNRYEEVPEAYRSLADE